MRWHEQYLGKPWVHNPDPPNSFNCGELLRYVYKMHLGYDAPILLADTNILKSCIDDVRNIQRYGAMKEVYPPHDFDIVVLTRSEMKYADHVGLYANGNVLHCRPKVGVFLDDIFTLHTLGWTNMKYYRLDGLSACIP